MGRADLIGIGKHHLTPTFQPLTDGNYTSARKKNLTAAWHRQREAHTQKLTPVRPSIGGRS